MNDFGSSALGYECYEQFRVLDYMNVFGLCSQGFRCYEHLKAMDDMNDSRSWAHDLRCYEQLRVADEMNELGLVISELWMTWIILGRELKLLNAINTSRF